MRIKLHFDQDYTSTKPIREERGPHSGAISRPTADVQPYMYDTAVCQYQFGNAVARPNIIGTTENNYWNNVCKCAYLTNLKWLELICQAS